MKWQMVVNGMSAASVARSLNKQKVSGKRGGEMARKCRKKDRGQYIPFREEQFPNTF